MNDQDVPEVAESVTSTDDAIRVQPQEHQRAPRKSSPYLFGIRRNDRRGRVLVLGLFALFHFLTEPEVQHALTLLAVRFLNGLAGR